MFLLSPLAPFARSKIPLGVHQETHQESHKQIFNGKAETIFLSNEEKHRSKPPLHPFQGFPLAPEVPTLNGNRLVSSF